MSSNAEYSDFHDSFEVQDSDLEVASVLAQGTHEHYQSGSRNAQRSQSSTGSIPVVPHLGVSPSRPSTVMSNAPRNNTMTVTPSIIPSVTLHQVAARGQIVLLKELLVEHDINEKDKHGFTPLLWAASKDQIETVDFLIKHGADCNTCGNEDQTAVHLVASAGYDRMLNFLLRNGFTNINQRTLEGNTALLCAVYHNHLGCVRTLLENGADLLLASSNGHSAPELAVRLGNQHMKSLIDSYMLKLLEIGCM